MMLHERCLRGLLVLILMVGAGGLAVAAGQYDFVGWTAQPIATVALPVGGQPAPYIISFYGRTFTPGSTPGDPGSSIWYYLVESPEQQAISHWVLELCLPTHEVLAVNENTTAGSVSYDVGYDKFTGITGLKWDEGFDSSRIKQQSVTLAGNWEVDWIDVGVKPGSAAYVGEILGPSCNLAPEIELSVSGLAPLTIDQPLIGQWAGGGGSYIASLGDLSVSVTVSGSVSYSLFVSYELGAGQTPIGLGFTGAPVSYEYPTGSGVWFDIPEGPSGATLHGMSGTSTDSHDYPVRLNLDTLGDRQAGDLIEFLLTVTVTSN